MSESLEEKLREQVDKAMWGDLLPHFDRSGVILVSEDLDLVEVAVALAKDDVDVVQNWLDKKMIFKPDQAYVNQWQNEKQFSFIIIQPYVIIQYQPN